MLKRSLVVAGFISLITVSSFAESHASSHEHGMVADKVIAEQRAMLEKNTDGKGFGPQAPRDID